MRRLALGALLLVAMAPPALEAAATSPSHVDSWAPERAHAQLNIQGGPASNDIGLEFDRATARYEVSDAAGILAGVDCEAVGPNRVWCKRWPRDGFAAGLGPGDDRFRLLMRGRGGSLHGGRGDDQIYSGDHRNVILGEGGQDDLRGRGGNDSLHGDPGHDVLVGGAGNDRLEARDRDRDRRIDCGAGHDVALIDPRLDPAPVSCEVVVHKPRPR